MPPPVKIKLTVRPKMTTKIFTDPDICRREVAWYLRVPWACPQLLDNTDRHLITETGQPVTDDPTPELRQLVTTWPTECAVEKNAVWVAEAEF